MLLKTPTFYASVRFALVGLVMDPDAENDGPRFKAHVQLLRQATRGIGGDIEAEYKVVEKKIARLPHSIGKDYDHLHDEIELDLARLSYKAHKSIKAFPKHVEEDLAKAGKAVKHGAAIAAKAPVVYTARGLKAAKKGTQKGLAKAAGSYHDPLEAWSRSDEPSSKSS